MAILDTVTSLVGDIISSNVNAKWGRLNKHLIARFFEVEREETQDSETKETITNWKEKEGGNVVYAALSEGQFQVDAQWTSPFERAGAEQKAPALFAMLQSGSLQVVVDSINPFKSSNGSSVDDKVDSTLKKFEGRTGITKLNSTQIYEGMTPLKINVTAILRAWMDAAEEVEKPLNQLIEWSLPEKLAGDTTLTKEMVETAKGNRESLIEALLPSKVPARIGMTYKGRTYKPLVIEAISYQMTSPINVNGQFVEVAVDLTLESLSAIDKDDWKTISGYTTLF